MSRAHWLSCGLDFLIASSTYFLYLTSVFISKIITIINLINLMTIVNYLQCFSTLTSIITLKRIDKNRGYSKISLTLFRIFKKKLGKFKEKFSEKYLYSEIHTRKFYWENFISKLTLCEDFFLSLRNLEENIWKIRNSSENLFLRID